MNLPLAKHFLGLNLADKDSLKAKFYAMYYAWERQRERLFTDYPDLLNFQTKNRISKLSVTYSTPDASAYSTDYIGEVMHKDLKNLISKQIYFSVLPYSSTHSSVTEQETIYVLFTCEGTPVLKHLSIENVKKTHALSLKSTLEVVFSCFGITDDYKLVGLNLDGLSINMDKHNGLKVLIQEKLPGLRLPNVSTTNLS